MVQLHNFFFFITFMVVPRGTAAPVLFKWFVSRDVPTGAPFSNGTIIPIPIPSFPLLVYLHFRKFIRSVDGAKRGVLVRANRPILLLEEIGRSSSKTRARNALFRFVLVIHFLLLKYKGDFSYLESFCGVLRLLFFRTFFFLPKSRSAKRERRRKGQTLRPKWKKCIDNTKKIQFTQRLPLGSELHIGKERCCLRGLDHLHGPTFHSICGNLMIYKPSLCRATSYLCASYRFVSHSSTHSETTYLTNDRLLFEHDESLRADLLPIHFPASYENGKLEHFFSLISLKSIQNREKNNLCLTMFPEKRYFRERTSTTEVAIHTNLFTDLYASIGTGSRRKGGWYTTIMKKPFIFYIRKGFMLASLGGSRSLLRKLQKGKLRWN
nr:CcmFc [Cuscuta australis]